MAMATNTDAPRSSKETDSFLKRLAGPSTGKAGLAKDQSEINRIIAEASKGSKYYNNEKRRDQELTEKINALLILRDDLLLNSNISKVEHDVDRLLSQLDAERDLSQIIVHVDMDAFFANVELLDNPSLAGKPFGVGHGVLTTASYEARKFGVRSGMATHIARKLCPELIITSISHGRYSEMSDKVFNVLRRYDPTLFAAGCDEGYLNITAYCKEHDLTASDCVQQIRKTVYEETSLTASAGIAPNLMLAKICSDRNKPNGQFELTCDPQAITEFMRELPIRRIPGIGRVSERLLDSIGVKTCGDIYKYRATISLLDKQFGLEGLLKKYLGIGSNVVQPWQREERKSIGAERTFHSLSEKDKILGKLDEIAAELAGDMERHGFAAKTITLKYKLHTYEVFTRAKSCDRWITKKDDLYAIGKELVLKELPITIRLIGLRATKLKDLREDSSLIGIKRFFPVPTDSSTPPQKRPRFEYADDTEITAVDDGPYVQEALAPILPIQDEIEGKTGDGYPTLTCPLCSKELKTDNNGLNEHIDFCLSKSAISAAQAEAREPQVADKPVSKGRPPHSSSKPKSSSSSASLASFWSRPVEPKEGA